VVLNCIVRRPCATAPGPGIKTTQAEALCYLRRKPGTRILRVRTGLLD